MQPETGIKPWQWVVTVVVIILIVLGGIYLFKGNGGSSTSTTETPTSTEPASNTPAAGANGLIVAPQFPGNIVYVSTVQLAQPGLVVIYKDNAGVPGAVIGSKAFPVGINPGQINLTQSMVDGGTYYAALFSDVNGNGKFDPATDTAVNDAAGQAILKSFRASANAASNVKG